MRSETPQSEEMSTLMAGADPDLRELRGILIGQELGQLEAIQRRLDDPALRSQDMSVIIAEAIAIRARADHKLPTALRPLLEEALQLSVDRNPEVLARSLFPIIGGAVREAVADALQGAFESLNQLLNRGFSLESWKWRVEALTTGKSFGQVALTRSLTYRVEQVFLIHRETGLLLGHVSFDDGVMKDADLISGMLTAIQDFVHDSFKPKRTGNLKVMQVGEFNLWIQHGPLALLAAVVSGQPPPELREVFERELEAIRTEFKPVLEHYDGDSATIAGAEVNLRRCLLGAQKMKVGRKSKASLWLAFAVVVLVIAALTGLRIRDHLRWSHYVDRLRNEPGLVVVDAQRHWFSYAVNGLRDPLAVEPAALLGEYKVPAKKVNEHWEPYLSLDPAFAVARRMEAEKALVERQVIRFDVNSAQLPVSQFDTLDTAAEGINTLRQTAGALHQRMTVKIEGHTDQTGEQGKNMELSKLRAQTVTQMLLKRGVPADVLNAAGVGQSRPEHADDASYPAQLDRRVTFTVTLTPAWGAAQ